jgi:hypothetical protein
MVCSVCKKEKGPEQFNWKIKKLKTRQSACRECCKIRNKKYYLENREYFKKKSRINNRKSQVRLHQYILEYFLKHPCVDCGEKDPRVLDFDHLKDKYRNISAMVKAQVSHSRLNKEIEKCEVRCANCHRKRTSDIFHYWS